MIKKSSQGRHLKTALITLAVVLLLVVVILVRLDPAQEEAGGSAAVAVELSEVQTVTLEDTVRGIGTLRAPLAVELSPEIAGRVERIHFQEGGAVEEGQLLIELEDAKLRSQLEARQAAVRAAEVRLNNAQRIFNRQQQLLEQGVAAEEEFERTQAELDSAAADLERFQAELALTEQQLQDTSILAPFAGTIGQRLVDRGAFVSAGTALASLYQLDPLELSFSIPERYLGQVRPGQPVTITVAAYPDREFRGEVSFVSPAVDESTRTLALKAQVSNSEQLLRPGAFATLLVVTEQRQNRPVIPEEALVATRSGYMVFVVEDQTAHARQVETGLRRGGLVEITAGLQAGDVVVRQGHMRLDDGTPVNPVGDN